MTVECAWCGCIVGEKDGLGLNGITSGICGDCFSTIAEQIALLEGPQKPETVARRVARWLSDS